MRGKGPRAPVSPGVVQGYINSWRGQILKRFFISLTMAIIILVGYAVKAEQKEPIYIESDELSPELFLHGGKAYFGGLGSLERFVAVSVSVEGSTDIIGLDKNLLTDYARLRFRNSFVGMNLEKTIKIIDEQRSKTGIVYIKIKTVGDDYPIAYYVSCNAITFSSEFLLELSCLGVTSKNDAPNTIRDAISNLMDSLAIRFFKDKGKM